MSPTQELALQELGQVGEPLQPTPPTPQALSFGPEFQVAVQEATEAMQASQVGHLSTVGRGEGSEPKPKNVSLPKIQLPTFNGGLQRWQGFWDIFHSSVDEQALPKVMKFNYLKGTLRGAAATAIEGIPVT